MQNQGRLRFLISAVRRHRKLYRKECVERGLSSLWCSVRRGLYLYIHAGSAVIDLYTRHHHHMQTT